jgi:hypothetical protein
MACEALRGEEHPNICRWDWKRRWLTTRRKPDERLQALRRHADRPRVHNQPCATSCILRTWHWNSDPFSQFPLGKDKGHSSAVGWHGLTKKIADCYLAIISAWRPGDRIYLFGFSRGAYTARCVSHVLEACGIPTAQPGQTSLNLDPTSVRKVASEAVGSLYTLGMPIRNETLAQEKANAFRRKYSSAVGPETGAFAFMVGIWDAVAAIGWQRIFPDWAYDRHFAKDVRYARHLQSIDEGRSDFKRVAWGGSGTVLEPPRENEPDQFEQIWFAGNHADIGGSYPENESRLSDITLNWMVDFITNKIPEPNKVFVDPESLRLYPASAGMMHDECMVGIGGTDLKWTRAVRDIPHDAVLHHTVYERLEMPEVRNFTSFGPYRPAALRNHDKAKAYYAAT